VIAVLYQLS